MTTFARACLPTLPPWHELYRSALFETDRSRLPERIAQAERAIAARAQEIFGALTDTIEEDHAIDDAMYALRALRNCLSLERLSVRDQEVRLRA